MEKGQLSHFIFDGNDVIGINLGCGHGPDHLLGIDCIKHYFGIDPQANGITGCAAAKIPEHQISFGVGEYLGYPAALLRFAEHPDFPCGLQTHVLIPPCHPLALSPVALRCEGIATAWDSGSFCIYAVGDGEVEALKQVFGAFLDKDVIIGLSTAVALSGFRSAMSLVILRKSAASVREIEKLEIGRKLSDAITKTGIIPRLVACGKDNWAALRPGWTPGDMRDKTKHPVVFWLYPDDETKDNYGWFTVEELEAWTSGDGPIPKHTPTQEV